MKVKKIAFTTLAAMMALSAFAGCKDSTDYSNDPSTWKSLESGEVITITLAGRDNDNEKSNFKTFIEEFNNASDQIVVDLQWWSSTSGYNTALDGMGKDLPDVFMLPTHKFISYANAGKLAALDEHLSEGILDDLYSGGYEVYQFDQTTKTVGKSESSSLYGLPKDQGAVALCINEDLLKAKVTAYNNTASDADKIDIDKVMSTTEPMTFTYFLEIGNKLKSVLGEGQYICTGYDLQSIVYSNNASFFTSDVKTSLIDSDEFVGAIQFIQDMYKQGILPDVDKNTSGETVFTSGNSIFYYAQPYKTKDYWKSCGFTWNLLPVLRGDGTYGDETKTVSTAYVSGMCYAISAQSKYKDAALQVVEYLATNVDSQRSQYSAGQSIPNLISLTDEYVTNKLNNLGGANPTNRSVWIDAIDGVGATKTDAQGNTYTDKITGKFRAESYTYNETWLTYLNTYMNGQTNDSFWKKNGSGNWVDVKTALQSYKAQNQEELDSLYNLLHR